MNRRRLLFELALLVTLVLCTAAKGYEYYVESNIPVYQGFVYKEKQPNPVYYRVTTTLGDNKSLVSNVVMVWSNEEGEFSGNRVLDYGDFELLQEEASKISDRDVNVFVQNLCKMSNEEYTAFIEKIKTGREYATLINKK